ncbi:hypothetical protein [Ottowia sp.]|uniref:hypothetical protein n=1 Tax=Ottowia sp. TaxID=1898956 RepID=UPI002B56A93D|nr:hypothetical protein [Ottowia sp.]
MSADTWTHAEKRAARRIYDAALERELAQVMAEFKRRAAAASQPQDMWAVETYLSKAGRDINAKYDYRYSVLEFVFARLLREGRIEDSELHGLSDDRLERIRRIAAL